MCLIQDRLIPVFGENCTKTKFCINQKIQTKRINEAIDSNEHTNTLYFFLFFFFAFMYKNEVPGKLIVDR